MESNNQEPKTAAITAGIPKRSKTVLSALPPTSINLKILFEKCTTPVSAIANSTGKKTINTGVRIVPNPNPEKKVRMAAKKATNGMIMNSIELFFLVFCKIIKKETVGLVHYFKENN
jgi:hypothetical protein